MGSWFEIAVVVLVGAAVIIALGRCLSAAERRGWIRLHGVSKGSAAVAFAAMEDMVLGLAQPGQSAARSAEAGLGFVPPHRGTGSTTGHRLRAGTPAN